MFPSFHHTVQCWSCLLHLLLVRSNDLLWLKDNRAGFSSEHNHRFLRFFLDCRTAFLDFHFPLRIPGISPSFSVDSATAATLDVHGHYDYHASSVNGRGLVSVSDFVCLA